VVEIALPGGGFIKKSIESQANRSTESWFEIITIPDIKTTWEKLTGII
jgi:hypothetical protein